MPFPVSQSLWRELEDPREGEQLVLASPRQLDHAAASGPCQEVHLAGSGQSCPVEEARLNLEGFCPPAHLPPLHPACLRCSGRADSAKFTYWDNE